MKGVDGWNGLERTHQRFPIPLVFKKNKKKVAHIGHSHPALQRAALQQLGEINTNTRSVVRQPIRGRRRF